MNTPITAFRRRSAVAIAVAGVSVLALAGCASTPSAPEAATGGEAPAAIDSVNVIVPADPGGGWDQTGRAMEQVLTSEELVGSAPVTNIGGAGGTIGLASLATETDPYTLFVTGLVMVGAVETNASEARIEDATPIARLTEEPLVIVVPDASPYKTLEDLVDDIVKNKKDVSITGGSAGGADHILAGLLLGAAGVPADETNDTLNYIANAGGGEAVTLLLGNNVSAGISGVGEFAEQIKAGELRALAVSSPERSDVLPDAPTIIEEGYDVELTNWRGVLAPGDITDEEKTALVGLVTDMQETPGWQSVLEDRGWSDAFLAGDEFDSYLTENISTIQGTLKTIGLIQ